MAAHGASGSMYAQNGRSAKDECGRHQTSFTDPREKEEKQIFGSNWCCLHQNVSTRRLHHIRNGLIQKHFSSLTIVAQSIHLDGPEEHGESTWGTPSNGLNGRPDSTYGISAVHKPEPGLWWTWLTIVVVALQRPRTSGSGNVPDNTTSAEPFQTFAKFWNLRLHAGEEPAENLSQSRALGELHLRSRPSCTG